MKYFFDTEFIEGWKKPIKWLPTIGRFNKPYHSVEAISIGIVGEDGREYYAISNEFNPRDASDWVKENVISKLPKRKFYVNPGYTKNNSIYKSNKQIAKEIFEFINPHHVFGFDWKIRNEKHDTVALSKAHDITFKYSDFEKKGQDIGYAQPEFYAYYADYDWVLFCSLFGTMMDLPKGFPKYCIDLKQSFDEAVMKHAIGVNNALQNGVYPIPKEHYKSDQKQFEEMMKMYKEAPEYPKQENEHDALDDAKWNRKLYEFIKSI